MDLNQLPQFLVQAKINTYAKSGEDQATVLADGQKSFEFEAGSFKYVDTYSGFNPFSGKETVFYLGQAIWEMSYQGEVLAPGVEPKEVYQFLKQALGQVNVGQPFRGPSHFSDGGFEYRNKVEGDINKFQGKETISIDNQEVYHSHYFGGVIKTT